MPRAVVFSGERLKFLRLKRGLSRYGLSKATGWRVRERSIVRYEEESTAPSVNAAMCLARALGVQLSELVEEL